VTPNEHECSATPNQPRHEVKPNVPAPRKSVSEKQHELKKRLQQQYAGRSGRLSQYSTPRATPASDSGCIRSDDIMGRANANVAEYADNRIEEEGKQTSIPVTEGYIDNCLKQEDDCSLLDRVNDLILMGYQADLTFERDFVAEGIDMLNRFSA
jgi:hypothetical protein